MKIDWDQLMKVRDEAKWQRLSTPNEGVPLKAPTITYLKKWGLDKYKRAKPEKRVRNQLKSIVLGDLDGPRVVKYQPINEHNQQNTIVRQ